MMSNSTSSSSTTTDVSSSVQPDESESDPTIENDAEDKNKSSDAALNSLSSASVVDDFLSKFSSAHEQKTSIVEPSTSFPPSSSAPNAFVKEPPLPVSDDSEKPPDTNVKPSSEFETTDSSLPCQIPVTVENMESSNKGQTLGNKIGFSGDELPTKLDNAVAASQLEDTEAMTEQIDDETLLANFPVADMLRLEEMISNPRWVVPVLPGGQLEILMEAALELCKRDIDIKSDNCQRFFREGLSISFSKILTDDAVSSWKPEIQKCILTNSERLVDLVVSKLSQDWFPLLDLLGILFNPNNKFHTFNASRQSELVTDPPIPDEELYSRPAEGRFCKGWLVDLINRFGFQNGFQLIKERFERPTSTISMHLVFTMIRPFGLCAEFLTRRTVEVYFTPVIQAVLKFLDTMSDDELKKETAKSDVISNVIKFLKALKVRTIDSDEEMRELEIFRLRMILRMLQVSSFNGKMNALNEINQVIQNVTSSHYTGHQYRLEDVEYLSPKRIADWFAENQVLRIVLRDSLHQPQYVEKLEKILRFVIKEKSLTLNDLDDLWAAQVGKHDAIVKNVHDLLAKLAWDFSPEQLDHLFECFQASWKTANRRQREKLLELIRKLAEDDKDGVMAFKVLTLFWNLAHSTEVPTEIMDQALTAHVKVLDYSCSQRDNQKLQWLNKSMDQLEGDDVNWVVPAMKHMREIFNLHLESTHKTASSSSRPSVITYMQEHRKLVIVVCESLKTYMEKVRSYVKDKGSLDPQNVKLDGRYSHVDQIRERLTFLKYLLKDGQLWLIENQANLIWEALAEAPAFPCDREFCFEWFSTLMGDDPDLEPQVTKPFFERKILTFDATLLTDIGMDCFERFFRHVNVNEKKLTIKHENMLMDDLDLNGLDYIWKIILSGSEDMASRAIRFLRQIWTALGPKLMPNQLEVHEDFLSSCIDRLRGFYDTILVLEKDKDSTNRVRQEVTRACRVLRVLYEYIVEYDCDYGEERAFIPLYRAARAKNLIVTVRISSSGGRAFEDVDVFTHFNETSAGLRRQIIRRLREHLQLQTPFKVELYYGGENIDFSEDRRTIFQNGFRDKILLQAKLTQNNLTNSPDSSEESSGGSPNHYSSGVDGPNKEAEELLPSVMMSRDKKKMEFLCQLCNLGSTIAEERLREAARSLLSALPACRHTEEALKSAFMTTPALQQEKRSYVILFNSDPAVVLYRLEVLYALLFPAANYGSPETMQLLNLFFVSGGAIMVVEMLTKNNFMPLADVATKRSAYLTVLKLTKAVLTIVIHLVIRYETNANHVTGSDKMKAVLDIIDAVKSIPNPNYECVLRQISEKISGSLFALVKTPDALNTENVREILNAALEGNLPDTETIKLIIRLANATSSDSLAYFSSEQHHANRDPTEDDTYVCEEALETLTLSFVLNPGALDQIINEPTWKQFFRQILFYTYGRAIRNAASEQFYAIATQCGNGGSGNYSVLTLFIVQLFEIVSSCVRTMPNQSRDVFCLLCNLLRFASDHGIPLPKYRTYLNSQIEWLRQSKEHVKTHGEGSAFEELQEGHICIARELTSFLTSEEKRQLGSGSEGEGGSLIKEILEEFVYPWSKAYSEMKRTGEIMSDSPVIICSSPITQAAILELVVALCANSYPNLKLTVEILTQLFNYSTDGDGTLTEWEYIPPVGNRPMGGFVGLKNAGATCYMNSVLQQLFMVENIRRGILGVTIKSGEGNDDDSNGEADKQVTVYNGPNQQQSPMSLDPNTDDRKSYNVCILKQIQAIFGHLTMSKLQYYVPNGLWKHFRLQGEPVNLREQQDAVEFFMGLVESVDDGLKALGEEQVMSKNLGGFFSDQKICKECPHRYSKEEPFSVISVDIRNHSNLPDSLEQYVKGELLEGADAYHCERCNKKVVTVKRLCVKRLPPVLAIQLKRFEYDYERLCPIKFNDYFEFPRDLDMEPYTVSGLAKIEGEMIDGDDAALLGQNVCSTYKLTGTVVHSGQASGGHYYSYISFKCPDGQWRWFKFDDGDVSECLMHDDEELKNQCFGGDYNGERMSFRRQKRWWNAYILFYTRTDVLDSNISAKFSQMSLMDKKCKIPQHIEQNVLRNNVEFMHLRLHFSIEYFQFVKKLVGTNCMLVTEPPEDMPRDELEKIALLSIKMATQFLFSIGFRTKRTLRGSAAEWYDVLWPYLKEFKSVRFWLATHGLFRDQCRIGEFLLECPSSDVRQIFAKILLMLAWCSKNDGVYVPSVPMATLSRSANKNAHLWEYILEAVLNLLRREVSEYGRNLGQYFGFFLLYASRGPEEKIQLLNMEVPSTFMLVAVDEGPAPPIKYQCADLSKLYQLVSMLIRSCDVSEACKTQNDEPLRPNPYKEPSVEEPLVPLSSTVCDHIYNSRGYSCPVYIKKILDEAFATDDTIHLLQFLSWENYGFSQIVLCDILSHISYSYTTDMKSYLELLMYLMKIEDSWQTERISIALKGFPDDKEGLIDIIYRHRQSQPKRSYIFLKCVANFMEPNSIGHRILAASPELYRKWNASIEWLGNELDRRHANPAQVYPYNTPNWSPPSNENINGSFFLERSLSAKNTLERAVKLRVDPEQSEQEEDQISSEGEEPSNSSKMFCVNQMMTQLNPNEIIGLLKPSMSDAEQGDQPKLSPRSRRERLALTDTNKRGSNTKYQDQPFETKSNDGKGEETCLDAPPNSPPSSNENLHEMSEIPISTTTTTTNVGKVSDESPTETSTTTPNNLGRPSIL